MMRITLINSTTHSANSVPMGDMRIIFTIIVAFFGLFALGISANASRAFGDECLDLAYRELQDREARLLEHDQLKNHYTSFALNLKLPKGKSEAPLVLDPFSENHILPERHLYLRAGDHTKRIGDYAVAHDVVNGQVISRETLETVWVESAQKYKLKITLEKFDKMNKQT